MRELRLEGELDRRHEDSKQIVATSKDEFGGWWAEDGASLRRDGMPAQKLREDNGP